MEPGSYFKSTCANCGGRIEVPAEGAGMWIDCPHCGQKTQLVAPPPPLDSSTQQPFTATTKPRTRWPLFIGLGCVVFAAIAAAVVAFFFHTAKTDRALATPPVQQGTQPKHSQPKPEPEPDLWNGLKPTPVSIEKSGKSRLMYAIGTIRNDADKQRFGVKVTLDILDENGGKVGVATDYTQFIDAHKEWNFKALVTSSKATTAKVTAITEN